MVLVMFGREDKFTDDEMMGFVSMGLVDIRAGTGQASKWV